MVDIQSYMEHMVRLLRVRFGQRLLYVGLQGSYLRGEATETSDVDAMVVLDELKISDLETYRQVKNAMEVPEKACGFICGKDDLAHWNPMEICHLLHTTKDCFGCLARLVPAYGENDVRNFVKMSVNNLYHELCHRYIYGERQKNVDHLPGTYKGVFFILQNLYFLESGVFVPTKRELLLRLSGKNRRVLEREWIFPARGSMIFPKALSCSLHGVRKQCIDYKGGMNMEVILLLAFCVAFVFLLVKSIVLAMADYKDGFVMRWNTFLYLLLTSACLCGMMLCMVNLH